ncbi:MAG: BrnA antitoxin family protein [Candidatus Omnitrophota bacterium]
MNKKTHDTDEPLELKRMDDFLPSPEQLVQEEDNVKVTITLSRHSVEFFKKQAQKHKAKYQTMIRNVLDRYARHYNK